MLDNSLFLSDAQAVTASAPSTNVLDLGGGDLHNPLYFVAKVDVDFATLTSLTVALQTADTSDFASAETLATLPACAVADLKAGKILCAVALPLGLKKFIRANYTVAGSNATAGKVSAFLTDNPGVGLI